MTHIHRPEVETREPAAQHARDDAAWRRQLRYLFDRSDFYRDKFRAAGVADAASCGGLDELARLPFTEKDEIRRSQAEAPPFGHHLAADPAALQRIYSTSGTTGDPCYMPVTAQDLANWIEISSRSYTAGGLRRGMRVVSTYNAGPFVAGAALDTITALGVCHIPVGTGNTARLVRALQLMRPEALLCTPSYAVHLAEQLAAQGIAADGLGLRRICVAGEPGGGEAQMRGRIEGAFGAMLCEAMGIGDVSISLWGECDAQQGMHFGGGDHVHVELVDPESGAPVEQRDGATGELVYTALTREAVPLARFRSRDHVVWWSSPCACGRTTPRVRCIGRTDDLVIVRGVNVFPSAVRAVAAGFAPQVSGAMVIRPLRRGVRQDPPLPVHVELGPGEAAPPAGLARAIEQAVRATLVASVRVTLVPFGSIGRSEYKTKLLDFGDAT
ncbi:phenylacetate--CoA ligase family protein [Falsiroseomonas sp.]|uniref:phenylacetate--CoA ligase family protein n=1 Tax=Falsiroseomonas sp. TaxID=2870721 RepID=UPI00356B5E0D